MKLLYLFLFFTQATGFFKTYHHPQYQDIHNELSEGLKKDSRKTFITLSNAMYESRVIKEKLSNKSSEKKNYLLSKKMNQRRKIFIPDWDNMETPERYTLRKLLAENSAIPIKLHEINQLNEIAKKSNNTLF